jgi:steroid delta-isomerase-like uncharacterized protein
LAETRTGSNSGTAASAAPIDKPKAPGRKRITRRKAVETHVRSYFDALAARDPNTAGEHWSEDAVHEPVPIGPLRGRQAIEGFLRELYAAVPDLETTVGRLVAGEHNAAVEWRMRGTFDGAAFQGIEPTGKQVEMRGVDFFDVEDGLLTRCTGYYDGAEFARQAGMLPARDSGAERAMTSAFNTVTKLRRAVSERRGG